MIYSSIKDELARISMELNVQMDAILHPDEIIDLQNRYNEPWRHYHSEWHIAEGLQKICELITKGRLPRDLARKIEIIRAWVYHDSVYIPNNTLNEQLSAGLAETMGMKYKVALPIVHHTVSDHIVSTKEHSPQLTATADDTRLIIDIDLMRLGNSWSDFVSDAELVLQEYKLLGISEDDFYIGRSNWAKHFLERDKIFLSGHFLHLEDQAVENLERTAEA